MNFNYYKDLEDTILKILSNRSNVCEIIKNCEGAYPTDVKMVLEKLIQLNHIILEDNEYRLANIKNIPKNSFNNQTIDVNTITEIDLLLSNLSKPHPADYDWRFTTLTVYNLLEKIKKYVSGESLIALFGVTTLYPIINKYGNDISAHIYNKSKSLIFDLDKMGFNNGLFNHDLFDSITNGYKYDLIVADPPWYNEFYNAFIVRTREVLKENGYLFLSVLPELTRPNVNNDRDYIDKCCNVNGLEKIAIYKGFLNYESPVFERLSLQAESINCENWRYGDLIVYRMQTGNTSSVVSGNTSLIEEPNWDEYILNDIKIKIRAQNDTSRLFSYENADITPLLGTVSRRSPLRERISFWTSENLAFKVHNLETLRYLLNLVDSGIKISAAVDSTRINKKLSDLEFSNLVTLLKKSNIYSG